MDLMLEHDFTLNGDGSGKAAVRWDGPEQGEGFDPRAFMSDEVAKARGIDAWESVSCAVENGRLIFQARVYFPDLAGLRFHCQGLHVSMLDFTAARDDKGNLVVESVVKEAEKPLAEKGASDEELRAQIAQERAKFAESRQFLEAFIGGLTCVTTFRVPGRILEARNLKKLDDHSAQARFRGSEIIRILNQFMEDDDLVLRVMKNPEQGPDALLGLASGAGPVRLVAEGGEDAAFPYAEEVAKAREQFEETASSLGLQRLPERSKPLAQVRVVAAKVVREADPEREFSPQSESHPCIVLTVCGALPGPAVKLEEAVLEALADAAGNSLLPEGDWERKIHFPKLAKDQVTAYFDVNVKADPSALEGFREIRGVLSVLVAGEAEDVDLGFETLKAGAEGQQLGARIEGLDTDDEDQTTLQLRLGVAMERVEKVMLVTGQGKEFPMSQGGYSACNDEVTFTYRIEGKPPKRARLVARVATKLQTFLVPFAIENVDLLGRPRG